MSRKFFCCVLATTFIKGCPKVVTPGTLTQMASLLENIRYIVGCSLIATGSLQPADLATFPPSVSRIIRDYRQLQNRYEMLFDFNDWDIKQLDEIVEILSEQPSIGIHGGDTPKLEDFEASIEFKDVAFHRPKWYESY